MFIQADSAARLPPDQNLRDDDYIMRGEDPPSTGPLPDFIPSPQQQAVFDWVQNRRGSAFIEAVAGAGKTTTLIEACKLMTHRGKPEYARLHSVAFVAYNTRIVNEIKRRTADLGLDYIRVGTFHSFGFGAWRKVHPNVKSGPEAAKEKTTRMLLKIACPPHLEGIVTKLVSFAKNAAVGISWRTDDMERWHALIDHFNLCEDIEDPEEMGTAIKLACQGLYWAKDIGHEIIDFDDMCWLPVLCNTKIWQHAWVLIDESQDTNDIRRILAERMGNRYTRYMWVGDRHQAIYGFTGADNDAVDQIIQKFQCMSLPLTVTYRCPKAVVAVAREYVPHIEAHETAPDGTVRNLSAKEFEADWAPHLRADDAIMCRKTAPLVSLAFKLIRKGIACHVEGKEIGEGLIKLAKRWKVKSITALRTKLTEYRTKEVAKLTAAQKDAQAEALADRVESLLILAEDCDNVDCVVNKIRTMFMDASGEKIKTLTLLTCHRAKGSEWDNAYVLGFNEYMPGRWARQQWEIDQEINLIYVAVTRAKQNLFLVQALEA